MIYHRNRLYISSTLQERMGYVKIVLGGLGLGSMIAECALRLGFTNLYLIDGDRVELSNLNRQNYTLSDLGQYKAEALQKRLKSINSDANIVIVNEFLTNENMRRHLMDADIAVNALDFSSDAPFLFDEVCCRQNIPVIHPYNLGHGALCIVFNKDSLSIRNIRSIHERMEVNVVDHILDGLSKSGYSMDNLRRVLKEYSEEPHKQEPPQLSIASYLAAGLCTDIFYDIVKHNEIAFFPKFYYIDKQLTIFE